MDLLEWLANRVRATYLSELREPRYWPRIVFRINEDEVGQFPLKEWEEAVSYIFHLDYRVKYKNIAEAREDCRKRLEQYRQEDIGQKKDRKEVSGWAVRCGKGQKWRVF